MAARRRLRLLFALAIVVTVSAHVARAGSSFPLASAFRRSPQVPVDGGTLQGYLNGIGENIQVERDQLVVELLSQSLSAHSTFTFDAEFVGNSGHVSGIYDGHLAHPTLVPVFPASATNGWFAVITFRSAPTRVAVNLFDENATLVSTTTTLGFDASGIGFYVEGSAGPVYSQDSRNAGGAAQVLFYAGTGVNLGAAWMAVATDPVATGDRRYDDAIWFIASPVVCVICSGYDSLTPVRRATWSDLKLHFH